MSQIKSIPIGTRFGRWTVLSFSHVNRWRTSMWLCRCDCGTERVVTPGCLRRYDSCGCITRERVTTHGLTKTDTYRCWASMVTRCENTKVVGYKDYGGRGITVCERWRHSFENFLADMGERPTGLSIDRIDNSKGYEPSNCRWATVKQQARNRRSSHFLTYNGQTMTMVEWAEKAGIPYLIFFDRFRKHWTMEEIMTTPLRRYTGIR